MAIIFKNVVLGLHNLHAIYCESVKLQVAGSACDMNL